MTWPLARKTAVTGIGWTEYSRASGRSVLALAVEACQKAMDDAGVAPERVDGIINFGLNDTVYPHAVATALGLPNVRHEVMNQAGGNMCVVTLAQAAMAIDADMASNVLVFRAMNGRSETRLGGTGREVQPAAGEAQYTMPVGWMSYPQYIAMMARRYMIKYGATSLDFAHVACTFRANAVLNERAMMRDPLTVDDHQQSRMIADPLRLMDICLESDGACAMLVSSADEARDLARPPIYILAASHGGGPRPGFAFDGFFTTDDLADMYAAHIADDLWRKAGLGPDDVDVASIYDCFTYSVLTQLEGFGFCPPGEGGAFVRDGNVALDGKLPVNTHGGMLSEAYIHGLNGAVEMVSQLRGDAGARQVPGAEIALASGFGGTTGSAVVLGA